MEEGTRLAQDGHPLSRRQVLARVALIIAIAEIAIMLMLAWLDLNLDIPYIILLDGALLLILGITPIFFWVIQPFVRAQELARRRAEHLAYHDPLTGLPNRRLLFEHLERALAACRRHGNYGALLLLDLDRFKQVNDLFGHAAGDALLVEIAKRLTDSKRAEDVAGRLSGDEFIVLVQQLGRERKAVTGKALAMASHLHAVLCQPVQHQGQFLRVGCSIGIRLLDGSSSDPSRVIQDADAAMYQAKRDGRSSIRLYSQPALAEVDIIGPVGPAGNSKWPPQRHVPPQQELFG